MNATDFHSIDVIAAFPMLVMVAGIALILLSDLFRVERAPLIMTLLACGTCALSWAFAVSSWYFDNAAFNGAIVLDPFGMFFSTIIPIRLK